MVDHRSVIRKHRYLSRAVSCHETLERLRYLAYRRIRSLETGLRLCMFDNADLLSPNDRKFPTGGTASRALLYRYIRSDWPSMWKPSLVSWRENDIPPRNVSVTTSCPTKRSQMIEYRISRRLCTPDLLLPQLKREFYCHAPFTLTEYQISRKLITAVLRWKRDETYIEIYLFVFKFRKSRKDYSMGPFLLVELSNTKFLKLPSRYHI